MQVMNRSYQIFKKLLVFNSSVLFAMSLQRLVLFLVVVRHWVFGISGSVLFESFLTGLRFDLCVLGFMNIPVLFLTWWICNDQMVHTQNPVLKALRKWSLWIYLGLITLIIHILAMLDLMYFATSGHRWTYYDWQEKGFDFFVTVATRWGSLFTGGIIAFFLLLWVFRSLFILFRVQIHTVDVPKEHQQFGIELLRGVLIPVFLVGLAARGTVTPHHLALEHAEVSQIQGLNQLALSPVWAFDKKF
jgi:hypothetical protein